MNLSVVIPTRNRSSLLEIVLKSLTLQTYPSENVEIIIVDNGSTDGTKIVVDSFKHLLPNLIYVYEPKPGLHVGRHAGLAIAKGEILVYGDDDIEAFPTWLEGIAESFVDPAVALVGGNDLPQYESSPPLWIETLWQTTPWGKTMGILSLLDFGNKIKEIPPHCVYGCNFSIRKSILLDVGGFHPDGMPDNLLKFRGDGETVVSEAILQRGYKTIFNPKASVYHWVPKSRMSMEYLYKRGYIQGISNSYADIRKKGKLTSISFYYYWLRHMTNNGKNKFLSIIGKTQSPKDYYSQGFIDGFLYHQKATLEDKNLLDWIQKKNYFEE